MGNNQPPWDNWREMYSNTPADYQGHHFDQPDSCDHRGIFSGVWGLCNMVLRKFGEGVWPESHLEKEKDLDIDVSPRLGLSIYKLFPFYVHSMAMHYYVRKR
ncbi:hypothetical protein DFS33DRAFT_1273485 [Desarmillaria ectypa]|nr:hypothetical protein DFS33DRAFT_1273485 [Desarmillaria ectypa]